jgi:hypothetical protein
VASSKPSLSFRIFQGDQLIREARLAQGVIKIGKVPSAHLRIDDESVSRMHAIVEVTAAGVHIIDLGSTRGTFVNGQKVHKAQLRTGDSIQLGDARVEIAIAEAALEAAVAPAAPPALEARPVALPPPLPLARTPELPAAPVAVAPAALAPAGSAALGGARAVEVAAMLGDSVIGVAHCVDPRGGKVARVTWALAAGGLACLLASAVAFYVSVDTAAQNAARLERHTRELGRPSYTFKPRAVGGATSGVAFGGLALGLAGLTLALVRARAERRSPCYRIGTAPGVEQPLEGAPSASFPLVAPSGDDFVFNYGPGIEGELIADGTSTPLAELAASGRVRPSATVPGAIEIPIPAAARIRARAGQATFLVSAVARPQPQVAAAFAGALEGRAMTYVAGSLALHLGIVFLLHQIPVADAGVNVDLGSREQLVMIGKDAGRETPPPPEQEAGDAGAGTDGESKQTTGMALPTGIAGDPGQQNDKGKLKIMDSDTAPQLSRAEALEQARTAGVLGSARLRDSISSLTSDLDLASGFDRENQWGLVDGSGGAGRGTFGMGVSGDGRGGNCFSPPCGIIGTGTHFTGTIGTGKYAGDGYWTGKGGNGKYREHVALVPKLGPPVVQNDGLDRSIIKRHVKQREAQIGYCYEKELLARPGLAGEVKISFLIGPSGTVQSAAGTGFDEVVASCVAGVIKNIAFPASKSGAPIGVNYPFIFRTAGRS